MIIGINTEIFEDVKSRKILLNKKTNEMYLINQKDELKVRMLKCNLINAISISFLIGYYFKFDLLLYTVLAAAIYGIYLLYFNKKIITNMDKVTRCIRKNSKDTLNKNKTNNKNNEKPLPYQAVAYVLISIGLIYCVLTNQVEAGYMTWLVYGSTVLSTCLGVFNFYLYFSKN